MLAESRSSLFISSHFNVIRRSPKLTVRCTMSPLPVSPHPYTVPRPRRRIVRSVFSKTFICCRFLAFTPSPSFQQWLKSWMYWHVSFHHANAGEERGERSGRGECVPRRKGPSQPRAKPCPSSGEPRRCDSVLLKPGQLLVTLAHRCTHSKDEVSHTHTHTQPLFSVK